jgi:hypothetical protein
MRTAALVGSMTAFPYGMQIALVFPNQSGRNVFLRTLCPARAAETVAFRRVNGCSVMGRARRWTYRNRMLQQIVDHVIAGDDNT